MVRCEGRVRRPWKTLACATLSLALGACGGGSGATPLDGGNGGGTATPESTYLLAEFVAGDSNNQFVRVWDPARPAVAIQNVRIANSSGIAWTTSHLLFADATQADAAARSLRTLGHAKVFYDDDGKLWSIDLRGGQPHAPVQLSSAGDVFALVGVFALGSDGADAVVDVQGGLHDWAISTSMAAADAPVSIQSIEGTMRDTATGYPAYFFASLGGPAGSHMQPTTWQVFDPALDAVDVPAVAAMVAGDRWLGADPGQSDLAYLEIAGEMHALRWGAGAVGVDAASLYTFVDPNLVTAAVADADTLYTTDDLTVLGVSNGAAHPVGTLSRYPAFLVDAGGWIAASELVPESPQCCVQIETVAKADGTLVSVTSGGADLLLAGADARQLIVRAAPAAPDGYTLFGGDGSVRATTTARAIGLVRDTTARFDQPAAPLALLGCVLDPMFGDCAAGALTEQDLGSLSVLTIGQLDATAAWLHGDMTAGLPGALPGETYLSVTAGFGSGQTDVRDAWQFTPESAGSLQRVTTNLP